MRCITIKGLKKTGKTTTCVRVVEELRRRGYSVAAVKNTHFPDFAMDTPGTDSHKLAQAGASTVTVIGIGETDILFQKMVPLKDVIHIYTEDYLVCESENDMGFANIIAGRTTEDLDARRDENTIGFSGIVSGELSEHDGLPVINATTDIEKLVDLIEEKSTVRE